MAATPKLYRFRKVAAAYAVAQGFPDYLAFGLSRLRSGAAVERIADELRPLFADRNWGEFPSREVVGSALRRFSTPEGQPTAREQLAIARRIRTERQREAARSRKASPSVSIASGLPGVLPFPVSYSTTVAPPRARLSNVR